jgi:hypothetical protein
MYDDNIHNRVHKPKVIEHVIFILKPDIFSDAYPFSNEFCQVRETETVLGYLLWFGSLMPTLCLWTCIHSFVIVIFITDYNYTLQ